MSNVQEQPAAATGDKEGPTSTKTAETTSSESKPAGSEAKKEA